MGQSYVMVFGAAVWPGGVPSNSLRHRVASAWQAASGIPNALFLVTGAKGRHGPAEAEVMRDLLVGLGACRARIICETESFDTLGSVINCTRILRARGDVECIYVCTSSYHQPRCSLLLRMMGFRTVTPKMEADRPALGLRKYAYYVFREILATPWDALQLYLWKVRNRAD